MLTAAKGLVRAVLRARGIELISPAARWGIDPWDDIRKLAQDWDRDIRTVVDVGANDGTTTALLLDRYSKAKVVSFEPQSALFEKISDRFRADKRVQPERLALGSREGSVAFYEYGSDKIASMVPNAPYAVRFAEQARVSETPCTTLDRYCALKGIDEIDILKIDTEGNDHVVLEGASEMIRSKRIGFVYTEFNSIDPVEGQFGGALSLISQLLHPAGYRFIASYPDYIITEAPMFSVSNALFALPR